MAVQPMPISMNMTRDGIAIPLSRETPESESATVRLHDRLRCVG